MAEFKTHIQSIYSASKVNINRTYVRMYVRPYVYVITINYKPCIIIQSNNQFR